MGIAGQGVAESNLPPEPGQCPGCLHLVGLGHGTGGGAGSGGGTIGIGGGGTRCGDSRGLGRAGLFVLALGNITVEAHHVYKRDNCQRENGG